MAFAKTSNEMDEIGIRDWFWKSDKLIIWKGSEQWLSYSSGELEMGIQFQVQQQDSRLLLKFLTVHCFVSIQFH